MVRLRFKEIEDGSKLFSIVNSVIGGDLYVTIYPDGKKAYISLNNGLNVIVSWQKNQKSHYIKLIKEKLKELGVIFDDEIRTKRKKKWINISC